MIKIATGHIKLLGNFIVLFICLLYLPAAFGSNRTVDLVVAYKTVYFAGKARQAIAVNDQIPAPTLHFKEGDHVTINVYNHLNKGTAIHWHGMLVPWQMDGVEGITQKPIPPGSVFHYQFTLYQAGTYWYHAHAGLQEQQGLYGAFVIDPPKPPHYKYTKDYVVVLSDWSNTYPEKILANLKKEGDYYSPRFKLQPSLVKFIHDYRKATPEERKLLISDYKMMQQMRMSIYDISDVAYDAFLLNGQSKTHPWTAPVKVGDIVRLRFIGASGSTNFRVKVPGSQMQMVHIQGNDVQAYIIDDFFITPGETYDVLVKIQKNEPYIIYAESADTLGAAVGALITDPQKIINYQQVMPFPEPLPVTREMMANMMAGMSSGSMNMKSSAMNMAGSNSSPTMMGHGSRSMNKPSGSSSMKMDSSMSMTSSMPMKSQQTPAKPATKAKKGTSTSSTMQMNGETSHNMDAMAKKSTENKSVDPADNALMKDSMKMNTATKIEPDNSMTQPMKNQQTSVEPASEKKIQKLKPKKETLASPAMPMKAETSHSMGSMTKTSMGNKSTNNAAMADNMKMNNGKMGQGMSMSDSMSMDMKMPTEPTIIGDTISPPNSYQAMTTGTKYQNLTAAVKTNDPNKPVNGIIRMELFGYMDRFIWMINGQTEHKAPPIRIEQGKRYRIIFTNNSMMHHPMHIHGHWFILRNGHGTYDPLLHTIDVPPGATAVADVDADASGQWFFHCHHLYHMVAGMARVFQYTTIVDIAKGTVKPQNQIVPQTYFNRPIVRVDESMPIDPSLVNHPMAHPRGLYLASFLDLGEDPFNNVQEVTFKGLYGPDYNKLELFTNDAETKEGQIENADMDIFYWHLISQFWAIKGGVNYYYRPADTPYWQPGAGIEGLMPYFIDTNIRTYYHDGSVKFDAELSRDTQITNNFFIRLGIRSILATATVAHDEVGSGLNQMRYEVRPYYRLAPGLNLFTEFEYDQDYGAFKNLQRDAGESTDESTLTFGVSVLF